MATADERRAFQGDRVVVRGQSFTEGWRLLTMRHQFRPLRIDRNRPAILAANLSAPHTTAHLECVDIADRREKIALEGRVATALSTECVLLFEKDGRCRLERLGTTITNLRHTRGDDRRPSEPSTASRQAAEAHKQLLQGGRRTKRQRSSAESPSGAAEDAPSEAPRRSQTAGTNATGAIGSRRDAAAPE